MKSSEPEKEPNCRYFLTQTLLRKLQLPKSAVEIEMLRQLSSSWFLMQAISSPLSWVQMVTAICGEGFDWMLNRKEYIYSGRRVSRKLQATCISPFFYFIDRNSSDINGSSFYSSFSFSLAYSASSGPSIAMVSWMLALLMLIGSWAESKPTRRSSKIFIMYYYQQAHMYFDKNDGSSQPQTEVRVLHLVAAQASMEAASSSMKARVDVICSVRMQFEGLACYIIAWMVSISAQCIMRRRYPLQLAYYLSLQSFAVLKLRDATIWANFMSSEDECSSNKKCRRCLTDQSCRVKVVQ